MKKQLFIITLALSTLSTGGLFGMKKISQKEYGEAKDLNTLVGDKETILKRQNTLSYFEAQTREELKTQQQNLVAQHNANGFGLEEAKDGNVLYKYSAQVGSWLISPFTPLTYFFMNKDEVAKRSSNLTKQIETINTEKNGATSLVKHLVAGTTFTTLAVLSYFGFANDKIQSFGSKYTTGASVGFASLASHSWMNAFHRFHLMWNTRSAAIAETGYAKMQKDHLAINGVLDRLAITEPNIINPDKVKSNKAKEYLRNMTQQVISTIKVIDDSETAINEHTALQSTISQKNTEIEGLKKTNGELQTQLKEATKEEEEKEKKKDEDGDK